VINDESGESIEPMEEVPLIEQGESKWRDWCVAGAEKPGVEAGHDNNYCKKLNSLKHLVRTNVAESHN